MPLWVLLLLIVGLTAAMYLWLRPTRVLTQRQWLVSHVVMWAGLGFTLGHILLLHQNDPRQVTMLLGGIWTLAGGVCFAVVYIVRQLRSVGSANH